VAIRPLIHLDQTSSTQTSSKAVQTSPASHLAHLLLDTVIAIDRAQVGHNFKSGELEYGVSGVDVFETSLHTPLVQLIYTMQASNKHLSYCLSDEIAEEDPPIGRVVTRYKILHQCFECGS
jgi:hypothetical protein